jgi:hypothetical protein
MELTNLHAALCAAQAEMGSAQEGGYNPHFRSSFATLTDLINASRPALTKNGLAVTQYPESDGESTYLITMLLHSSGESIESRVKMVLDKPSDVQSFGKTMTYLKRYVYAAIVGITISDAEDDDGNSISGREDLSRSSGSVTTSHGLISEKQYGMLKAILAGDSDKEAKICAHYKISDLSQLPWKHIQEVISRLKPKAD